MNDDKVPAGKYAVSTSTEILKDVKVLVPEPLLVHYGSSSSGHRSFNRSKRFT
jgi:hypothetical protein